jgi:hypothetical protein
MYRSCQASMFDTDHQITTFCVLTQHSTAGWHTVPSMHTALIFCSIDLCPWRYCSHSCKTTVKVKLSLCTAWRRSPQALICNLSWRCIGRDTDLAVRVQIIWKCLGKLSGDSVWTCGGWIFRSVKAGTCVEVRDTAPSFLKFSEFLLFICDFDARSPGSRARAGSGIVWHWQWHELGFAKPCEAPVSPTPWELQLRSF